MQGTPTPETHGYGATTALTGIPRGHHAPMTAKQAADAMRDAATDEPGISAEEFATELENCQPPRHRNGDDFADYGGVLGADGHIYSDADPGL